MDDEAEEAQEEEEEEAQEEAVAAALQAAIGSEAGFVHIAATLWTQLTALLDGSAPPPSPPAKWPAFKSGLTTFLAGLGTYLPFSFVDVGMCGLLPTMLCIVLVS